MTADRWAAVDAHAATAQAASQGTWNALIVCAFIAICIIVVGVCLTCRLGRGHDDTSSDLLERYPDDREWINLRRAVEDGRSDFNVKPIKRGES